MTQHQFALFGVISAQCNERDYNEPTYILCTPELVGWVGNTISQVFPSVHIAYTQWKPIYICVYQWRTHIVFGKKNNKSYNYHNYT